MITKQLDCSYFHLASLTMDVLFVFHLVLLEPLQDCKELKGGKQIKEIILRDRLQ